MRVAIDARMLDYKYGLGRYLWELVYFLPFLDKNLNLILFLNESNFDKIVFSKEKTNNLEKIVWPKIFENRIKKIKVNIPWYSFQEQFIFWRILNNYNFDLIHFPHFNLPILYSKPFVVTIHDLIMYHFPKIEATTHGQMIYWLKDKAHRLVVNKAIKKAKNIICPSYFVKQDILNNFSVNSDKIFVTHLAVFHQQNIFKSKTKIKNLSLNSDYVLYVGSAYPHKNLNRLLQAWQIFKKQTKRSEKLVLVGLNNYFYQKLINSTLFLQTPDVVYLGSVNQNDLNNLYKKAKLFVFPSLYEGFGLPPLEAMNFGVPVISSNASCLPEVLQDSVFYFDPYQVENIADVLTKVLESKEYLFELKMKGRDLNLKYSWLQTAQKTLLVYKQSLN